jgi:hypothetical protein
MNGKAKYFNYIYREYVHYAGIWNIIKIISLCITEDGREYFFYNQAQRFGKFIKFVNGVKTVEISYKTLGEFFDAV